MKKGLKLVAAILLVALFAVSALAEFDALLLNSTSVFFGPSKNSETIGVLDRGACVTVNKTQNGWALITKGGKQGFILSANLCAASPLKTATVKADAKFLYITRSNSTPKWTKLPKGTTVYVRGFDGKGHVLVSDKSFRILGYVEIGKLK